MKIEEGGSSGESQKSSQVEATILDDRLVGQTTKSRGIFRSLQVV